MCGICTGGGTMHCNGSGIVSQCKKRHFCVHLYLYSSASVFVRVVQLYLSECAIVFAQYERHSDTMREKGQDESFNTALPFDLTWPLEAGDFDEKCLFDQRMMLIMTIWSQHEESYDKNYADDVFISNVFHRDCFWILIMSVLETVIEGHQFIGTKFSDQTGPFD